MNERTLPSFMSLNLLGQKNWERQLDARARRLYFVNIRNFYVDNVTKRKLKSKNTAKSNM